jgi:hypothetical protein
MTLLLTVVATSPIAGFAVWSINKTTAELADPCARWESVANGQRITVSIGRDDVCQRVTVHGASKSRTVFVAALVPGGMLTAAFLGIVGVVLSRRRLVLAAAFGMFAETIPTIFSIAPLTFIVGMTLLFIARRVQRHSGTVAV